MAPVLESKQLLYPVGVFVLTVSLAATAVITGYRYMDQQERELRHAQGELASWEERLRQAESDTQAMQRALPRYQALKQRGVIGQNRDTALLAALGENARRYHLEQVKYQLTPSDTWKPAFSYEEGAFDVMISRMEVNARAYHEEEMMDLLASLIDKQGAGTVGTCEFTRESTGLSLEKASLAAQCKMVWFTLRERQVRR